MSDLELDLLSHYRALHDGLSDMIEDGRLHERDIPDDYQWLIAMLVEAVDLDHAARTEIAEEDDEDPPYISSVAPAHRRHEDVS